MGLASTRGLVAEPSSPRQLSPAPVSPELSPPLPPALPDALQDLGDPGSFQITALLWGLEHREVL